MRQAGFRSPLVLLLLQMVTVGVVASVRAETPRYSAFYSHRLVPTSPRSLPAPEGVRAVESQPRQDKVAGDEYWSPAFSRRGVWGEVYALAQDQGQLLTHA